MELEVTHDSDIPPFEQLRRQLIEQITTRALPAGTRLPPVRRLAEDLGLAANTVARTYKELEAEGFVVTRGRAGTVVSDIAAPDQATVTRAAELTDAFVASLHALGLGDDAVVAAVRRALGPGR
ncbi:GntR family transcriptional regulator [Tessaracoccus lacteus]|uniref:GntR family transcriptional regulator n=1 Tax=Tessaracoccus lacteus TaxID=3041766 RepID=UPI0032AF9817